MGGDWALDGESEFAESLLSIQGQVIAPLAAPTLFTGDVRGYESYYLNLIATVNGAPAYVAPRVNMIWTGSDPTGSNSFQALREDFEWWAGTASPGAGMDPVFGGGQYSCQDRMHGTSLAFTVANTSGVNSITVDARLLGTSRQLLRTYQSQSPYDDTLYENSAIVLPAFTSFQTPLPQYYGRIGIHRENIGGGAPTVLQIRWGSNPNLFAYHTMVSNAVDGNPQNFEIIAPRRPMLAVLANAAGGPTTSRLVITTQRDRE
jgi:hypothetical protein